MARKSARDLAAMAAGAGLVVILLGQHYVLATLVLVGVAVTVLFRTIYRHPEIGLSIGIVHGYVVPVGSDLAAKTGPDEGTGRRRHNGFCAAICADTQE